MAENFEKNVDYKEVITAIESNKLDIDLDKFYLFDELISNFDITGENSGGKSISINIEADSKNSVGGIGNDNNDDINSVKNPSSNSGNISNLTSPQINTLDSVPSPDKKSKNVVYPIYNNQNNIFYCNDNFYVLIRLLHSIYERTNKVNIIIT